jgi:hypothetical protein
MRFGRMRCKAPIVELGNLLASVFGITIPIFRS